MGQGVILCGKINKLVKAKASPKWHKSHRADPKPDDLFVGRAKSLEIKMEARTSVMYIYLDDLRLGVKSLSNLAMAGSS